MGIQFAAAQAVSAVSTWGLKHVFRRPAANFPGKVALYVDPRLIGHLKPRLRQGSIVVVGTNGKTTSTNLLADVLEANGQTVVCNRTGANLDSGVATSLLQSKGADWGVFESDELWLAKILPHLQANYVLLLNLFRDQLDRCGEIDRIQESIIGALSASPNTVLVYNADDPLCAYIASRAENASVAFGVAESMGLAQNTVADAQMCQHCSSMFEYSFRQYGQLGDYRCLNCGFARPALDYAAEDVQVGANGVSFALIGKRNEGRKAQEEQNLSSKAASCDSAAVSHTVSSGCEGRKLAVRSSLTGSYMVYNLAAVAALADLAGCSHAALQQAIDAFDPRNGRLQAYEVSGRRTLLNLAKNPTGFNQNLRIVAEDSSPKAVAFFINDKEADGRDISWIWDVDFEELAGQDCVVYAGGLRKNDLQVRLKYAGIKAQLVAGARDTFSRLENAVLSDGSALPPCASVYFIANYTALPVVHDELDGMAQAACADMEQMACADMSQEADAGKPDSKDEPDTVCVETPSSAPSSIPSSAPPSTLSSAPPSTLSSAPPSIPSSVVSENPLVIAHLFPDLLNLYGDGGNVRILEQRCRWRGIPVEVRRIHYGETVDLREVDLVFMGGGPDREQRLASQELMRMREGIRAFVEDDGVLLAICGGYQILGSTWLLGDEVVEGLGIVDIETRRAGSSANRLIDNIVLSSPLAKRPVVGYENHAGRTYLGDGLQPFGKVISSVGSGNNENDHGDGVLYRGVVGTYLHGTLLSKNPEVADALLQRALERWSRRAGGVQPTLAPLDDTEEEFANECMCRRLGVIR